MENKMIDEAKLQYQITDKIGEAEWVSFPVKGD